MCWWLRKRWILVLGQQRKSILDYLIAGGIRTVLVVNGLRGLIPSVGVWL
jgi:hypothetical protein